MADVDTAPPPPEVAPEEQAPAVESASAEQEVSAASEIDLKRKLVEVEPGTEPNGAGEDAKRPRVDGESDEAGVEQQNNESSVEVAEPAAAEDSKVAPSEGAADAVNGEAPLDADAQAGSDEKPVEPTLEAPQQAASATQETSRKIEVPNSKVGVLIGKAGETIKNLQMSSGAKIQITKDVDADSNALTRPVELVGSLESIDKAEQLIKEVIAEAEAGGSAALIARGFGSGQAGSEVFEMTIPDNKVGIIIGKGGESIRSMQGRSGARIQLIPQHPPEGVTLTERTVRISGNKNQIEAAKDLVKQAMTQEIEVSRHYLDNEPISIAIRYLQGIHLVAMVSKITALRVMVLLLSGGRRCVLKRSLVMDTRQEVCLHLRTTTIPTVATHSKHHQEEAWAGIRGHLILHIRAEVMTTTSRGLNHMMASHLATLLDQGTITMGNHSLLAMDNLSIRSRTNRTMVLDMVSLDTVLLHQTSSTMGSHPWALNKAILNSQIPILGLHTLDQDNGHPEVHRLQMEATRHLLLHLMGLHLSNLLRMVKHMALQLGLMGMLNRVTRSRVAKHQLHMHMQHQQHQVILSKAHSKVAMHSTRQPNQLMAIKQLKPMRTMVTRELQQILTMETPTHSQVMLLLRQLVRLVMLLHQQLASLLMARQDTPSHLQILPVMINLPHHRLRVAMLQPLQIHSLPLRKGCHRSLLLDIVGSGPLNF
ncbi:hypothetical protein EJB05_10229 [Eragrostis curvula]|uniref:K Homology domain-containing protein n=1 Tax=Eragrostis curvula TaxID=38414 RepID=A0A5J9W5Y8_9POAL|nr:hypothetical protein EJB05_10229 [Eragrostis curvula]